MTWTSDHKNQQQQNWWEWHYFFLLSCPHEHGHFWLFFTIQRQGLEQTTNLLFILKVLRCSNNLMQRMTSIIPIKLFIRKYFSKILNRNFDHCEGFSQNYQRWRPFTAIPSICNQRSLVESTFSFQLLSYSIEHPTHAGFLKFYFIMFHKWNSF